MTKIFLLFVLTSCIISAMVYGLVKLYYLIRKESNEELIYIKEQREELQEDKEILDKHINKMENLIKENKSEK